MTYRLGRCCPCAHNFIAVVKTLRAQRAGPRRAVPARSVWWRVEWEAACPFERDFELRSQRHCTTARVLSCIVPGRTEARACVCFKQAFKQRLACARCRAVHDLAQTEVSAARRRAAPAAELTRGCRLSAQASVATGWEGSSVWQKSPLLGGCIHIELVISPSQLGCSACASSARSRGAVLVQNCSTKTEQRPHRFGSTRHC